MKLQELSLSDLYGLRKSFHNGMFERYKLGDQEKILRAIENEIIRRETEIINEIIEKPEKEAIPFDRKDLAHSELLFIENPFKNRNL